MKLNRAVIKRTLELLYEPEHIFECRALGVTYDSRYTHKTVSGYFDREHADDLVDELEKMHSARGVYVTLNPCNPALLARAHYRIRTDGAATTADKDIVTRRWLPVDFDPERPSDIPSSDEEHDAAIALAYNVREALRERYGEPILADSGNGAHLLYRIDLPVDDGGLIERNLKWLSENFDTDTVKVDTTVFNPARIWKLYGTLAAKGDEAPEQNRKHRMAKLATDAVLPEPVEYERIQAIADLVTDSVKTVNVKGPVLTSFTNLQTQNGNKPVFSEQDINNLLQMLQIDVARKEHEQLAGGIRIMWHLKQCPICQQEGDATSHSVILGTEPGYKCMHDRCKDADGKRYNWKRLLQHIAPDVYESYYTKKPKKDKAREIDGFHLTDLGNAKLFRQFLHKIRWCEELDSWLVNTGPKWMIDQELQHGNVAMAIIQELHQQAELLQSDALREHAYNSESSGRFTAMIRMAKHITNVRTRDFMQPLNLLNCQNGVLNLDTLELLPHGADLMSRRVTNANYNPAADYTLWQQTVDAIFTGQKGMAEFMQRVCGTMLHGDVSDDKLFIPMGIGGNGKTTFLESFAYALGDYAKTAAATTFIKRRTPAIANDLAELWGARFVRAEEPEEDATLNTALIKAMTGGGEITCRFLYSNEFRYYPEYTVMMSCNSVPKIPDVSLGIWRRLLVLPFVNLFYGEKEQTDLQDRLIHEQADGILRWAVEGYQEYRKHGLNPPQCVRDATFQVLLESVPLARFMLAIYGHRAHQHDSGKTEVVKATACYEAYRLWHSNTKEPGDPLNETLFRRDIHKLGIKGIHKRDGNYYQFVKSKNEKIQTSVNSPSNVHNDHENALDAPIGEVRVLPIPEPPPTHVVHTAKSRKE